MAFPRAAGVLLHPTSLPSAGGIGDLGPEAHRFVDWLEAAGLSLWQMLPLGPTGYGDSPYQCFSAFAGNPLLIALSPLVEMGLLASDDVGHLPPLDGRQADFEAAWQRKSPLLRLAFDRFQNHRNASLWNQFQAFVAEEAGWLHDYACYEALREHFDGQPWWTWEPELRRRDQGAIEAWERRLSREIQYQAFLQFLFAAQWDAVKRYANERGIQIIGDIPIYVAHDSADVWAHQHLFTLDSAGHPTEVTGVPPDLFSKTGQLWGNPCYRWDVLAADGYRWWIDRFRRAFALTDIARVDHFRAFQAGWQVPASAETAMHGRWVPGPGRKLFDAVRAKLGEIAIIVEDLGIITPDVHALRADLGYPGMKVLQFAFGGASDNPYLPHNYEPHCVVYTGTHDNDTTRHWYATGSEEQNDHVRRYLGRDGSDVVWDLIRLALSSVAVMAVIPLQDVLELDGDARMNFPGTPYGNWQWRLR